MPRPGPRPYECVRRAWHSDRHQPIRGSLIQEIFRVANEVHNPTTRKNKEWLEKLPLVVLKAEEIMYSKANSEAEYMDLETLWERANDAIDTIIRRDDTPETEGDLLQPCIEAALNLGCIPRRASRSQRHSNPGCYLSSVNKEVNDMGSSMQALLPLPLPPNHLTNNQNSLSQLQSWYSTLVAPRSVGSDGSFGHKDLVPFPKFGIDPQSCPRLGRVYPLYYNYEQSPMNSQVLEGNLVTTSTCNPPSACEDGIGLLHNFFIGSKDIRAVSKTGLSIGKASENPHTNECDLSLRLGLFSPSSLERETGWNHEVEDVGSSSSCNGSKHSDQSPSETRMPNFESSFSSSKEKCFDFFSMDSADEPLEPGSSKWSSEEEGNVLHQRF